MTADSISADKIKAMRAAFEDAVNSIRSASTLKAVQDAIAAGDSWRILLSGPYFAGYFFKHTGYILFSISLSRVDHLGK